MQVMYSLHGTLHIRNPDYIVIMSFPVPVGKDLRLLKFEQMDMYFLKMLLVSKFL
jgi:hypothetical protein